MATPLPVFPVTLDIDYPDRELDRWLPLVKWFLAIPHYIVLWFLSIAAVVSVIEVDPGRVAQAAFDALAREISAGEMDDVRSIVPHDIRRLMRPVMRRPASKELEPGAVSAVHWGAEFA
jgi:hypothetical protein